MGGGRQRGSIKRGLDTERARQGTLRGFGTERARLGTFKKNLKKMLFFLLKKSKNQGKTWSFAWKIKNRPTCSDFEKKNIPDPQLQPNF